MLKKINFQDTRIRIMIFLGLVFILSITFIFNRLHNLAAGRAASESARSIYYEETIKTESGPFRLPAEEKASSRRIMPSMAALQEINPDVVGWIQIIGTGIDDPIVQGDDNLFYLDHNWKNESNRSGAIFMDYRNDPASFTKPGLHTILYGHNMRDQSMFHNLTYYKDFSFFENFPYIQVSDLYEVHHFEIFSVYITHTDFYYIETDFQSQHDFLQFLSLIKDKSMHQKEVNLSVHDHLLTISTCTYEHPDARLVIHARKIESLDERSAPDG
jgi:sortase B